MRTNRHDDILSFWGRREDAFIDQIPITIVLGSGRQLRSLYNPYFTTITIGATIFPERDLPVMTNLLYGDRPKAIYGARRK